MPRNYVELGDLDSALMYLNKSIEIDPFLRRLSLQQGDDTPRFWRYPELPSQSSITTSHINSNKDDTKAYYKRAYYKYEIEDLTGALADIERAMAKDSVPTPLHTYCVETSMLLKVRASRPKRTTTPSWKTPLVIIPVHVSLLSPIWVKGASNENP